MGLYPEDFLNQYSDIVKKFVEKNIDSLLRTFYYYDCPIPIKKHEKLLEKYKGKHAESWVKTYGFKKIKKEDEL